MRVLFFDLDTLRPDHLGCYGYHRETSPAIDAVAAEGVRFENYHCSDAPCLPSRAALVSGRFGIHTGVVNHGGTNADLRSEGPDRTFWSALKTEGLWEIFRQQGMHTVSVSPFAERHGFYDFYAGFSEMYNTGKGGIESAEEITPTVLDWLDRRGKEDDWLLHVNYWDPHTPYRAPEEFGNPFKDDPLPEWITPEVLEEHRKMIGPHDAREVAMFDNSEDPSFPRHPGEIRDMQDLRRMFDGYDCGIRYMDDHIGRIIAKARELNIWEDLIVIITADHGENIGELGIYGEHATADYTTTRIPMIIRWPGKQSAHVDDGFHYQLDLLPTLAECFGSDPSPRWDGESYAKVLNNGGSTGREALFVSQCSHVCQRAVRFGEWHYIRTYHDGYHLFPKELLFRISEDPHEEHNLAAQYPEVCREAVYKLYDWHDEMMASGPSSSDPLWEVMKEGGPFHSRGHLPHYIDYLKKTGREYGIDELMRRHPEEFS